MGSETDEPSNSVSPHREPPPSLGLVAHIWAGHLTDSVSNPAGDAADEVDMIDLTDPVTEPRASQLTSD